MLRTADISNCGTYRYRLGRVWDGQKPVCAFVMLNPSVADASIDDPTIRRVVDFAQRWRFGGVDVFNLFALRATDPGELLVHDDPVGPENDAWLERIASDTIVAAWGVHGTIKGRSFRVSRMLDGRLSCLGRTKGGHPRHPLYVRATTERSPYGH